MDYFRRGVDIMSAIQQMLLAATTSPSKPPTTWNPFDKQVGITLSGNNLVATSTSISDGVRGTNSKSSGKHYFEITLTGGANNAFIGIASSSWDSSSQLASDANSACYVNNFITVNGFSPMVSVTSLAIGDVVGVAVDVSSHKIYWAKNNVWQNSASPSDGTGGLDYVTTGPVFPAFFANVTGRTATLAVSTLTYSPPSGFNAWG